MAIFKKRKTEMELRNEISQLKIELDRGKRREEAFKRNRREQIEEHQRLKQKELQIQNRIITAEIRGYNRCLEENIEKGKAGNKEK